MDATATTSTHQTEPRNSANAVVPETGANKNDLRLGVARTEVVTSTFCGPPPTKWAQLKTEALYRGELYAECAQLCWLLDQAKPPIPVADTLKYSDDEFADFVQAKFGVRVPVAASQTRELLHALSPLPVPAVYWQQKSPAALMKELLAARRHTPDSFQRASGTHPKLLQTLLCDKPPSRLPKYRWGCIEDALHLGHDAVFQLPAFRHFIRPRTWRKYHDRLPKSAPTTIDTWQALRNAYPDIWHFTEQAWPERAELVWQALQADDQARLGEAAILAGRQPVQRDILDASTRSGQNYRRNFGLFFAYAKIEQQISRDIVSPELLLDDGLVQGFLEFRRDGLPPLCSPGRRTDFICKIQRPFLSRLERLVLPTVNQHLLRLAKNNDQ